ncbi:hypothetical protein [Streptomyces sp. NBC_01233]|uniref:hypothetical protein n=1 Tax=Streptomyces sp. NBC_01233 TaxID=2903787 RepID=UPI002E12AA21|nr:hypothetical protein OG332_45870 [Streptomyces sp. NBC_01233]
MNRFARLATRLLAARWGSYGWNRRAKPRERSPSAGRPERDPTQAYGSTAGGSRERAPRAAACSAQMRMRMRSEIGRRARQAAQDAVDAADGEAARAHELLNRSGPG